MGIEVIGIDHVAALIDVDKGDNADVVRKHGDPTQVGLPMLVVLDTAGKH